MKVRRICLTMCQMALRLADLAADTDTEPVVGTVVDLAPTGSSTSEPAPRTLSALIVHADDGWSALSEEIEVAADGDTMEEAFANLRAAVGAVLKIDRIDDRPQAPSADVLALIESHRGPEPIQVMVFQVQS